MSQPYTLIRTDPGNIFVFENIFDTWLENYGCKQLESQQFSYDNSAGPPSYLKWFGRMIFDRRQNFYAGDTPPFVNLIIEIFKNKLLLQVDDQAVFIEPNKIILNGMVPSTPGGPHQDDEVNSGIWSTVYFANDSDGDLIFLDGPDSDKEVYRIKYKKGTFIMFPACYYHCALAPTTPWRVTLGMTFRIETKLNYEIWGKGAFS
jgi:hypothetical protein